jgi:hypothetical protein
VLKRNVVEMEELNCVKSWCEIKFIVQGCGGLRQEVPR